MENIKMNWKTSLSGILAIVGAIVAVVTKVLSGQEVTGADITLLFTAISAGIGLLSARDNNVTSKDLNLPNS